MTIEAVALEGMPEVQPGDDLSELLGIDLRPTDVLVVAHKVVSKAEGRVVELADVEPGERALAFAAEWGKDPRPCRWCSTRRPRWCAPTPAGSSAARATASCARTRASTAPTPAGPDRAVLLPLDPDASARALRSALGCAVVISDSFGRPWRIGQMEIAIGCAGLAPLEDLRGQTDREGRVMHATHVAVADQAAAAADLARSKAGGTPAVRLRGPRAPRARPRRPGCGRARPRARARPV